MYRDMCTICDVESFLDKYNVTGTLNLLSWTKLKLNYSMFTYFYKITYDVLEYVWVLRDSPNYETLTPICMQVIPDTALCHYPVHQV